MATIVTVGVNFLFVVVVMSVIFVLIDVTLRAKYAFNVLRAEARALDHALNKAAAPLGGNKASGSNLWVKDALSSRWVSNTRFSGQFHVARDGSSSLCAPRN